ncbi:MAG: ATP-binding cassette domain-containing protein, partial [Bacteroidales bacterium]|nr:ATP-binding cassette domain-containing protein [Bacteroidales bacterium]
MAIVELKDVHKNYPLGKVQVQAVRGVSLSVNAGDFVTIAGPSGSGKSTILNMIGLVDRADSGEVYIDE